MEDEAPSQSKIKTSLTRRTMLSGVAGVTFGSALATGGAAAVEEYEEFISSVGLTPQPAAGGRVHSLNGTWEFALSASDTPPSGGSGGRVITPDRSSYGNDGTVYGDPPVVTDPTKRAVDLSGDARLTVGEATGLDFNAPGFAVELTFKYTENTILFSKGGDQYSAGVYGGELSFWTAGEGDYPTVTGGELSTGEWYTATFVFDESEMVIYVDGRQVGALEHGISSIPSTNSPLHVGYNAGSDTQGSPVVDTFNVFDTPLTPAQVRQGFDSIPDSAVAWFTFDDASGGTVPDGSAAGNDAQLVNDPSFVPGAEGQGLDLAGDGYVSAGSVSSLEFASTGFTLQTMVKYGGGSGLVLDKGSSPVSQGTEQFGLGIYDGTVSFYMQAADGTYPDSVQTDISAGEWHHLAVVVDGDENRLYVDGELRGSISHDAEGLASSEAPFVVGGDDLDISVKSTAAFDGVLSESELADGPERMLDSAVLWLTYNTLSDLSVEWGEEDVPGQWAYDDYYVPSGSSEWYPPDGELGWYRREFEVPDDWGDGRLKLQFGAVYSRALIYVNGTQLAEHVGGYTPFEVDITDTIDPEGTNTLAVGVAQRSPSDDMGWQNVTGGITRDVRLVAVPDAHLSDLNVRTDLADGGVSATVGVDTTVTNAGDTTLDGAEATVTLTGPEGATVATATADVPSLAAGAETEVSVGMDVADPTTWDPEHPHLHTVMVDLDAGGATERVTESVGIRDVTVDGNDLLINGTPVTLRGVNWEEIHLPEHGQAIPEEITREDARRLAEANVNYIRTAHHPTSEAFLDACDELGILVEVEAPHMFVGRDRGDPYPDVVVQQTLETVARDRNRPSVCIWSIANESEWYDVFETVAGLVDEVDPTRPKIFNHDVYNPSDPWHDEYEIRAHHYPALRSGSTIEEYSGMDAPLLYDEYAHTYCYNDRELVTDPGLRDEWGRVLETIWKRCRTAESVVGAALWAGGDHLEQWGEYLWGILDRNRRHRPEFWHVRKVYAPVVFSNPSWSASGNRLTLTVENRYEFTDLSETTITAASGDREEEVDVSLLPGERTDLSLPVPGEELRVEVRRNGRVVNEFAASPDTAGAGDTNDAEAHVETGDDAVTVTAGSLTARVDRETGEVTVRSDDGNTLVEGLEFAVTPTQQEAGREYETAIDHRLSGREVTGVRVTDEGVAVDVAYEVAEGTFTLAPRDGSLAVDYAFTLTEAIDAREAGLALPASTALTTLSWERDGLWSVYPADHIGRERGTAVAFPDGTRPESPAIDVQSGQPWRLDTTAHGSNDFRSTKRDIDWVDLTDGGSTGVRVVSGDGREQHVRAQAKTETTDLLVLDRSISGTNAYGWMNRQSVLNQNPTLSAGQTVSSAALLRSPASASDGDVDYYQVDFVAGDPITELGEEGLYAGEDRLLRFAFGAPDEGITERGSAWASADVRDCLADYGHIGRTDDGEATVTFTVADGCELTLSLAVHSMPGETFDRETADQQELLHSTTESFGPGEHTLVVPLPTD